MQTYYINVINVCNRTWRTGISTQAIAQLNTAHSNNNNNNNNNNNSTVCVCYRFWQVMCIIQEAGSWFTNDVVT